MRGRIWPVVLSAVLWVSSASMVHAGNNVWTSLGPEGGRVLALAIDPSTPTTLYAGRHGGGVFAITFSDLSLTLSLNGTSFQQGETLILTATVVPPETPLVVDGYVAVRLPDSQTLFFLQGDGSFTTALGPFASSFPVIPFTGELFRYTFSGGEPPGSYTWFAAFTQPGTLNIIGSIVQAPFGLRP